MSIHPFHDQLQSPPSRQISHCNRPPNKLSTFIIQNPLQNNQQKCQKTSRNMSKHKHKTFAAIDSKHQPQYQLVNNDQRKILLLLGLAQQFIQNYEDKNLSHEQSCKKKQKDSKIPSNFQSQSNFKIIQPKTNLKLQQQEAYNFFISIRNSIRTIYRQKFLNQIKRSTEKLDQIIQKSNEHDEKIHIQKSKSSLNLLPKYHQKTIPSTFITSNFNISSFSGQFPQTDLMNVSNFPESSSDILRNSKSLGQQKFHHLKVKSQRTMLRIHPVVNRYQSRKKQEIITFMQLNQKTEHLQNFRHEQGKFFKLNENLKITVKNVNFCRVVLLSKKNALIQQLDRLGDEIFFKQQNRRIKLLRDNQLKRSNSKRQDRSSQNGKQKQKLSSISQTIAFSPFKQKAIRVMSYFEQIVKYFSEIECFLLQFIRKDKSYQNYLHQNEIKQKLKANLKFTQKEKYYDEFVDQCFHMSQISRIYFNVLNQLTHFNHSISEFRIISKENLQKQTKRLIELRYSIIYLQKQCENTSQSPYLIDYNYKSKNLNSTNDNFYNTSYSYQPTYRSNENKQLQKMNSTVRVSPKINSGLKQNPMLKTTDQFKQLSLNKRNSKIQMSQPIFRPVQKIASTLERVPSEIIRNSIQKRKVALKSSNNAKQQNLDMTQIWKTFYNKKFSSNAMRLRSY